jgi:hypothetical protein
MVPDHLTDNHPQLALDAPVPLSGCLLLARLS